MKYMIMTFGDETAWDALGLGGSQATWSDEEVAEHFQAMGAFYADLAASGEMVTGFGLADPSHTVTVEMRDGRPVASDGPYAEAKESLAGYWVFEVKDEARVLELASQVVVWAERVEFREVPDGPPEQ